MANSLDRGEASSIALCQDYEESLSIIDENKGRKIAKEMKINVTGSLGVLVVAKENGYLKAIRPILNEIKHTNFRISENLIMAVLEKADEL